MGTERGVVGCREERGVGRTYRGGGAREVEDILVYRVYI